MRTLAGPLGDFLWRALARDESWDLITAVPLHWRKRWTRGFNQAELLARGLAGRSGLPYRPLLRRVRSTQSQAGLTSAMRRGNVRSAFACRAQHLAGKRILLIDDVMTTGSTVAACARALKQAGATRVGVLTVARADRRFDVRTTQEKRGAAAVAGPMEEVEAVDEAGASGPGGEQWGVRV